MPRPILYFVRHGETDWNREKRLQGQHDIPLNALGRTQAARCGGLMRDLLTRNGRGIAGHDYGSRPLRPARGIADYDSVSTPLGRAREPMDLMRGVMELEPSLYRTDARLMEMSF